MKSLGGYYSRFKRAFLFRENPVEKLNVTVMEITKESEDQTRNTEKTEQKKETVSYIITEDQHTKTGEKIWIVKPEKQLSKVDFAEVRQKLATLQGYCSSFVKGFIFKYNPEEALQTG